MTAHLVNLKLLRMGMPWAAGDAALLPVTMVTAMTRIMGPVQFATAPIRRVGHHLGVVSGAPGLLLTWNRPQRPPKAVQEGHLVTLPWMGPWARPSL